MRLHTSLSKGPLISLVDLHVAWGFILYFFLSVWEAFFIRRGLYLLRTEERPGTRNKTPATPTALQITRCLSEHRALRGARKRLARAFQRLSALSPDVSYAESAAVISTVEITGALSLIKTYSLGGGRGKKGSSPLPTSKTPDISSCKKKKIEEPMRNFYKGMPCRLRFVNLGWKKKCM